MMCQDLNYCGNIENLSISDKNEQKCFLRVLQMQRITAIFFIKDWSLKKAYLWGAACAAWREAAGGLVGTGVAGHGKAALVAAIRFPAAVALFAGLDDAIAADGRLRLGEAAAAAARLGRQHRTDRV